MLNKTKAALQGRQCNYKKLKPSQITTLIDQVNNLGRVEGCDKKCIDYKLTAPLAQLIRYARISAHTVLNCGKLTVLPSVILRPLISLAFSQSKSFATWWVCPDLDRPQPIDMSDFPQWGKSTPMADTLRKSSLARDGIPSLEQNQSVSFAFLRWRRLISPCKADTTNCPMLSPSSLSSSTELAISCGTRTSNLFDFAFTDFVAITGFPVY
ncbi:Uncharacterised protein [Yersinia pseudotuberculosis]|uniref:Uncharacterized protein n=1 Tax=Yersinia pseudotuberculosis serotype O:3 (strain YPIII) TaxID=502800 RepID=A0A0H3AXS5_YERPY|nr:hypothetical protein BZ22_1205 [Yersinia pseudotuberculosis YPIII]SQA57710.1 Uncharacterised protein [Yersinia pseudotuberculosis]